MDINIGKGITLTVDPTKLPDAVMDHVVKIGLRNILMDCHAGITQADFPADFRERARAKAEEKLTAMIRGEVRVAREGGERDPVHSEAVRIATAQVTKIIGAKGQVKNEQEWSRLEPQIPGADAIAKRAALIDAISRSSACRGDAERIIAARSTAPALDVSTIKFG